MGLSSIVRFRRATLADRNGVLSIDPMLFGGLDYMSAMYTSILQDKTYRPYVAVTPEGEIVSFMAIMVDPEKEFCCIVSGRTSEKYKGKGIVHKLSLQAALDLHNELGKIPERLHVASDKPHVYKQEFWSDPDRILIQRHAFLVYVVPHSRVVAAVEACKSSQRIAPINIEKLNLDRAYKIISDPYVLQHVLRKPYLMAFCNSLPMPKNPKYLKRIASESNVFASFKRDSDRPNGISFSSLIRGPVHVNVDISLSVYDHVDILLAHLAQHLTHVADVVPANTTVGFRIHFPPEIDKDLVKEFLHPSLGLNRIGKVHPMEYIMLWKDAEMKAKL